MKRSIGLIAISLFLSACAVGPDYVRPQTTAPVTFKEAKGWKQAQPQDTFDRGQWWMAFHDPQLNALESQLVASNQSIKTAEANYDQAQALVDEAQAGFFPTITGAVSFTRQGTGNTSSNANSTGNSNNFGASSTNSPTSHSISVNASWTADVFGSIRRTVEANEAAAQASGALLASTRLIQQATLAQDYFQLRALDTDQKLLDDTVRDYKTALQLTKNQYASGVAGQADVVQAESQLETTEASAINNKIARAQFEHAIAVLMGRQPESLSIPSEPLVEKPPYIPLVVPSTLLERRPDIAQAERTMAQANAQIGVAIAAYYPTLTLSAFSGVTNSGIDNWFSLPALGWSVGPQLAETLFDGGLRKATTAAARATYEADAASYRQTVLAAFQNVEDNLASVRILKQEGVVQDQAAKSAREALQITINQYKSGTVAYSSVVTAQTNAFTAEKNAADITGQRMVSAVGLIEALGGGWNASQLKAKS